MNEIEKSALCYGLLSPEDQAEMEAMAEKDVPLAELLNEGKALHALMTSAGFHLDQEGDDDLLAYLAVSRHLSTKRRSFEILQADLLARIEASPALQERLQIYEARIQSLEAVAADPIEQFQALSGHQLSDFDKKTEFADDREAVKPPRQRILRPVPTIALMVVLLALATFPLLLFHLRLVSLSDLNPEVYVQEGMAPLTRNTTAPLDSLSTEALFAQGLAIMQEAQEPCFLMQTCYKLEDAEQGIEVMQQAAGRADSSPELRQKAGLVEAKMRLARRDWNGAEAALVLAEQEEGPYAEEVRRLLRFASRFAR